MPKAETLTYDFASYDTSRFWRSNATNVAFVDGQLKLTATTSYHYIASFLDYDMTDSYYAVEFVQNFNAGSNGSLTSTFRALDSSGDGGEYAQITISGGPTGNVIFRERVGGVDDDTTGTYNATDYRYLRIRESSGTIFWETSANGYAWTVRRSKVSALDVSVSDVLLSSGRWAAEASPGNAWYDNLNLMPEAPPSTGNPGAFFSVL